MRTNSTMVLILAGVLTLWPGRSANHSVKYTGKRWTSVWYSSTHLIFLARMPGQVTRMTDDRDDLTMMSRSKNW